MIRPFVLLFISAVFLAQASGRHDSLDPDFEKVPFDRWLAQPDQSPFRWNVAAARPELSFHQRLEVEIKSTLDGRDLEIRRSKGQLVFFVQITDSGGTRYQDHGSIDLGKLNENVKAGNLEYSQRAFVLPGDYRLAVAVLDTATGEHSTHQMQFRAPSPQRAFLPDAWRNLLSVEFIGAGPSPESWYLPDIQGRLQWAASVSSPERLNVILNVAPSVPAAGSRPTPGGDLSALLPTLKVISQTGSSSLSEYVELLDLARRRAVFKQNDVRDLDWPRLKASLGEANTASIDIHSLSERHHDAQFFVSEVRNLLRSSEKSCVLAVLTKSVAFESGEDLEPISLEALPACRVFYIRYHARVEPVRPFDEQMGRRGRGSRMDGPMIRNRLSQDFDQLEATLRPLSPKVFDVDTPEQITKALAEIDKALLISEGQSSR